jgi:hypothetical protein
MSASVYAQCLCVGGIRGSIRATDAEAGISNVDNCFLGMERPVLGDDAASEPRQQREAGRKCYKHPRAHTPSTQRTTVLAMSILLTGCNERDLFHEKDGCHPVTFQVSIRLSSHQIQERHIR